MTWEPRSESELQEKAWHGDRARVAQEVITEILADIEKRCFSDFCAFGVDQPIKNLIDMGRPHPELMVIPLRMAVIRDIRKELTRRIVGGNEAFDRLNQIKEEKKV